LRRSLSAGITAGALVAIALTGCGTASTPSHAQPAPTVTKTSVRIVTKTVVRIVTKTVTKTVKVPEPGPTVTVNADAAQLQADNTCINALYQNIQGWKASGIVPNGWWDARCPTP
jgi:ABC-type transport system substrate-binding protein